LVLGTLSLGTYAQEAFYIYRNDGDFNGFFYDEVVEMRQSKIGVDSIVYDKWVTQEVVLADTIYRIPLAAIDSIGFQQPEIKLNPKVKFVERDGYSPYLTMVRERYVAFENLPANLKLHEGDVLIGLPTDQIAATKYEESIGYSGHTKWNTVKWSSMANPVGTKWENFGSTSISSQWIANSSTGYKASIVFKTKTKGNTIEWYETGVRFEIGNGVL
jgi:hypothetical protein